MKKINVLILGGCIEGKRPIKENYVYLTKRQLARHNLKAHIDLMAIEGNPQDTFTMAKSSKQYDIIVLRIRTAQLLQKTKHLKWFNSQSHILNALNYLMGAITLKPLMVFWQELEEIRRLALEVEKDQHLVLIGAMVKNKTLYKKPLIELFNAKLRKIKPDYIVLAEDNIFYDQTHLNALGHACLSEILSKEILDWSEVQQSSEKRLISTECFRADAGNATTTTRL